MSLIQRSSTLLLVLCLAVSMSGCAAILRGMSETVVVRTSPEGRSVWYQGQQVSDGAHVTVRKTLEAPQFNVGSPERPILVDVHYDPDPLIIADAVLLVFFVVPGLVALGVDFGTGAWRDLHDHQMVYMPER